MNRNMDRRRNQQDGKWSEIEWTETKWRNAHQMEECACDGQGGMVEVSKQLIEHGSPNRLFSQTPLPTVEQNSTRTSDLNLDTKIGQTKR